MCRKSHGIIMINMETDRVGFTIIQVWFPTTSCDDEEIGQMCEDNQSTNVWLPLRLHCNEENVGLGSTNDR